ncbi:hypothetical protein ACEWY4_024931 [Coilia grayii]|uniref:AIG1-type G domain-containing protein n=1 Tax=Coilia grayii TaxID=363190 RepID=A0ABD1IW53_9TELE
MVGETGTGKTTLINSMITHILGVKFEDKMWFEITEEKEKSQAKSQTACVTAYEVHIADKPTSYTIIDTPGYGDTGGRKEDKQIAKHLLELFTSYEGVRSINAIGLVVKASENRLTESQQYIFDAVVSLFGHNVKKNIVIFITHSDGTIPKNALNAVKEAQIPCATDTNGDPVYFSFNNISAQPMGKTKVPKIYEAYWSAREESMEEFLEFLNNTEETNLRMTEDVIKNREALEACIINLQQRVVKMEQKQNELEQIQAAVLDNKEKLDNNENFEIEVEEVIQALVPIKTVFSKCEEKATHCTICKENCHFPGCTWVSNDDLWWCHVMKNGQCTVCTNRCSYTNHVKDEKMYINVTQKTKKTAHNLRKRYDEAYGKGISMKAGIEAELSKSKNEQANFLNEAYEKIMKLQEIALKKDAKSVLVHLDFLISRLKKCGKHQEAENLEEIQRRAPTVSTGVKAFCQTLVSHVWRT